MQSLSESHLQDLLSFALKQIEFIENTTSGVRSYDEFLSSQSGMVLFNSTCMCLQTIGETLLKYNKATKGEVLFKEFPLIPWKSIFAMRNIISHEYLAVDPEIIFMTIKNDLPILKSALSKLIVVSRTKCKNSPTE